MPTDESFPLKQRLRDLGFSEALIQRILEGDLYMSLYVTKPTDPKEVTVTRRAYPWVRGCPSLRRKPWQ
jgi:hypothetical protein